jgi:hypothetical protein
MIVRLETDVRYDSDLVERLRHDEVSVEHDVHFDFSRKPLT